MTKDNWDELYDSVDDLYAEFLRKWRKNDFKFQTQKNAMMIEFIR